MAPPPAWTNFANRGAGGSVNGNKRAKPKHEYIPPPSSGAYLILTGLYKAEQNDYMQNFSKQQVLDFAVKYSETTFSDRAKIWASMKGLIDKSLLDRQISRDPLYYLLEDGRQLAAKLIAFKDGASLGQLMVTNNEASNTCDTKESETLSQQANSGCNQKFEPFSLLHGSYEIILIVDQREKIEYNQISNLIKIDTRILSCGDFLWIARPLNALPNDRTKELVLDYIVERKRLDDLMSSLFDGRFEQQKLRLKNCGVRHPCYLIEDCGRLREARLTASNLNQAITSVEIHDKFTVERVKNVAATLDYLVKMTKCIMEFLNKKEMHLMACSQEKLKSGEASKNEFMTFSEFQTKGAKITNWTVREMFAKHLIQISGMSDKKVAAILGTYPTVSSLLNAYDACDSEKAKENLVSKLQMPDANRCIGPVVSSRVYACYASPQDF